MRNMGEAFEEENIKPYGEVTNDEFVSGFSLSGDYVKNMADKSFTITAVRTELFPDFKNPQQKEKKTILTVKLHDGVVLDYFPNKTSIRFIVGKRGFRLADWIGFEGKLTTVSMVLDGKKKDVIYIEGSI
jgi:hypothetical protein